MVSTISIYSMESTTSTSTQQYNIKGGYITTTDAVRAMNDGKATLQCISRKVQKDGKDICSFIDLQLYINSERVNTVTFSNTRFYPLKFYKDENGVVKKPEGANTYMLIRGNRKLQSLSNRGFPWKVQGNSDLFEFIDKYSVLVQTSLSQSKLVVGSIDHESFRIKRDQDKNGDSNFEWSYSFKLPSWNNVPNTRFYRPQLNANNIVSAGQEHKISSNDELVGMLGQNGLFCVQGFLQLDSPCIGTTKRL
jgi:hypothetical protein